MRRLATKRRLSSGGSGVALLLGVLLGGFICTGCRYGKFQVAPYLTETCEFPNYGKDELFILIEQPGNQHDTCTVMFQDVPILAIGNIHKEMGYYKRSKHALKGARFTATVRSLVEPRVTATSSGRESHDILFDLQEIGRLWLTFDHSGYGYARLDYARIEFEKDFIERLHKQTASPLQKEGNRYRFKVRFKGGESKEVHDVGIDNLQFTASRAWLDPDEVNLPRIDIEAVVQRKVETKKRIQYREVWYYYPKNPVDPTAGPARVLHPPPKADREEIEEPVYDEHTTYETGSSEPAANMKVTYTVPELTKYPQFSSMGKIPLDAGGKGTISLVNYLDAAELPLDGITFKFSAESMPTVKKRVDFREPFVSREILYKWRELLKKQSAGRP